MRKNIFSLKMLGLRSSLRDLVDGKKKGEKEEGKKKKIVNRKSACAHYSHRIGQHRRTRTRRSVRLCPVGTSTAWHRLENTSCPDGLRSGRRGRNLHDTLSKPSRVKLIGRALAR